MAMKFYASTSSNPFDHDGHFPALNLNTNFINHVNEIPPSKPAIGSHDQNDHYNILSPTVDTAHAGLGQVGLIQRVTEVRRTYVTRHKVQVHSFTEYSPLLQNQPTAAAAAFSPNGVVTISEVRTTPFLTPTSTMQRLFVPNYQNVLTQVLVPNHFHGLIGNNDHRVLNNQDQPSFTNQILSSCSQVSNHPFAATKPFHHSLHRNRSLNQQTLNTVAPKDDLFDQGSKNGVLDPKPLNAFLSPVRADDEQVVIQSMDNNEVGVAKYDGRTHSLPCKKYGPYECPKCRGVFNVSQKFAAHMWSHYKNESSDERKKRLAARYKKKNLRLIYSDEGLTVVPDETVMEHTRRRKGRPGNSKSEALVEDHGVQLRGKKKNVAAATGGSSHGGTVKIKEEPTAEKFKFEVKIKKEIM